jgi:bifunctional DNase/RNase
METEIKLTITGLVYNQTVIGTYGLVLSEEFGSRRFSVMIGEPEAQSIALKMNKKKSPRPLTHDLIKSLLNLFEAKLQKVVIYDMINDVFFSELHIVKDDKLIVVDARTSDAVALAVRADCPIFIKSEILELVGTEVETEAQTQKQETTQIGLDDLTVEDLDLLPLDALDELLEVALQEEKYELAVNLRDAIQRRKELE